MSILMPVDALNQRSSKTMQKMPQLENVKPKTQQKTHTPTPASSQIHAFSVDP